MPHRHQLVIPLPHGRSPRDASVGRLSLFVVPHLEGAPPWEFGGDFAGRHHLADYPHDWARWPDVLLGRPGVPGLTFDVAVNGTVVPANQGIGVGSAQWVSARPIPAAWRDTFGLAGGAPGIAVERYRAVDQRQAELAPMYDAAALSEHVHALHDLLATTYPTEPPTTGQLASLAPFVAISRSTHLQDYAAHLTPLKSSVDPDDDDDDDLTDIDFHQATSFLQAHPQLLRVLGLVIDLEVRLPRGQVNSVAVGSDYPSHYDGVDGRAREIRTRVGVSNSFWPAAPETAGLTEFWAQVGDGSHHLGTIDLPTAVSNLTDLLEPGAATRSADSTAGDIGADDSAGVYVARPGDLVKAEIEARYERQHSFWTSVRQQLLSSQQLPPIPIDARDVAVGLRYDVFDTTTGRWHSVWERHPRAGVRFPQSPEKLQLDLTDDEGWLTVTAFTEAGHDLVRPDEVPEQPLAPIVDRTPHRVSPMVFSWRGWSLAARPPGRAVSLVAGAVAPTPSTPPPDAALQAEIQYEVPDGVLPRLRYGRQYRLRARVVDYAGNSHPLAAPHPRDLTETDDALFGRETPVAPPTVARRGDRPVPGWGDSPTVVVIRSEIDQHDDTVVPADRIVYPPNTAVQRCVLHGRPEPDGLFTDDDVFHEIVRRDASRLDELLRPDPLTGELMADGDAWRPAIPYLPDVAAAGIAVDGLPGSGGVVTAPFTGDWPARAALGFRVRGGDRPPTTHVAADHPAVICFVPKGITRQVRVSSTIDGSTLPHWGLFARATSQQQRDLAPIIRDGRHWMVSARAPLTLVHAVRLPLALPTVAGLVARRPEVDDRRVALAGTLGLDVKSTDRVDVIVTWTDLVDRGDPAGLEPVTTRQVLFSQREVYAEDSSRPLDDTPHDAGDTKRHLATVTLEGFSRYATHFAERRTVEFRSTGDRVAFHDAAVAEGNVEISTGGQRLVIGRDVLVDEAAGSIEHLARGSAPVGQPIDVDFIPLPISRLSTEAGGGTGEWEVLIPNSGVPDAVPVGDALPAFARTSTIRDDAVEIVHDGRVVRIWVDRPWFTTGAGELLGVVIDPSLPSHETLHSRVARDPLNEAAGPLPLAAFPRATVTRDDVDGTGLTVAAHPVTFDPQRQQWFADVQIGDDIGYRPFVQLSLGRFQPESVEGAHLGDTVMTEPVRLGPSRRVNAVRAGNDLDVTVVGLGPRNRVTAQLQRRDERVADPDLGWIDVGDPLELDRQESRGIWTGALALPADDEPHRLVVIDAELLQRSAGTTVVEEPTTAYVETIALPADWRQLPDPPPAVPWISGDEGDAAITVRWGEVDPVEGAATTYVVEHRPHRGTAVLHPPTPDTELTIEGLDNGVRHDVRVAARYGEVQGPWSDTIRLTPTAPTEPGQVTDLTGTAGDAEVHLEWVPPVHDGGTPITGYLVEMRIGSGAWEPADVAPDAGATTATVSGLENGVTHRFRVSAVNAAGPGRPSNTVTLTPEGEPPDDGVTAPDPVAGLDGTPGDEQAILAWDAPADGGAPIVRYEVEQAPGTGPAVWAPAVTEPPGDVTTTTATVVGLTNGDRYRFRVRAVNAADLAGGWSSTITVTPEGPPPPAPPSEPSQVTGFSSAPGDGEVSLWWDAPADDGGAPIERYELEWRDGNAQWAHLRDVAGDERPDVDAPLVIGALHNGTRYRFRVRAVNVAGAGRWSSTETVTPHAG